jgi:hypothetical protein
MTLPIPTLDIFFAKFPECISFFDRMAVQSGHNFPHVAAETMRIVHFLKNKNGVLDQLAVLHNLRAQFPRLSPIFLRPEDFMHYKRIIDFSDDSADGNQHASAFSESLGRLLAIEDLSQSRVSPRPLEWFEDKGPAGQLNYLDIASGPNGKDFLEYILLHPSKSRRKLLLLDHSFFVRSYLEESAMRFKLSPEIVDVVQADAHKLPSLYRPESFGCIRLCNVGEFLSVQFDDWFYNIANLVTKDHGKLVVIASVPNVDFWPCHATDHGLSNLLVGLDHINPDNAAIVTSFWNILSSQGSREWSVTYGETDNQGEVLNRPPRITYRNMLHPTFVFERHRPR